MTEQTPPNRRSKLPVILAAGSTGLMTVAGAGGGAYAAPKIGVPAWIGATAGTPVGGALGFLLNRRALRRDDRLTGDSIEEPGYEKEKKLRDGILVARYLHMQEDARRLAHLTVLADIIMGMPGSHELLQAMLDKAPKDVALDSAKQKAWDAEFDALFQELIVDYAKQGGYKESTPPLR